MKNKRIFALILSFALILTYFPAMASTEERTEVYTEFSTGNSSHTGKGTKDSPYNLFDDALDKVADGGTIYIGANGAFVNDASDGQPLKITKNVTITRAPGIEFRPTLEMRKGGLVLGSDVTFSNIILSFPNGNHAAVFANGYTLALNNISYCQGAHVIQLAGGALYNINGQSLSPASGKHSKVIISGGDTQFGNIYAGSINGGFSGSVDIELNGVSGSSVGTIYSCGAKEGFYNKDNFLDPYNEPEAPVTNSSLYPVTGGVSINLTDSPVRSIDGKTGGTDNASLTVSSECRYESDLNSIGSITVKSGTFAPRTLNNDVNVNILSDGILDMSSIPECSVNDFHSDNGILVLSETGRLTINGLCEGSAELRTPAGSRDTSGIAVYDHLYIKTAGNGSFTFKPYSTQEDMTLNKTDEGWRTNVQPENSNKVVIKDFDIVSPVVVTSKSQVNGRADSNTTVEFNVKFTEDSSEYSYIDEIPFEYDVTYNGTAYGHIKPEKFYEIYIGVIPQLHLNLIPSSCYDEEEPLHRMMIANFSDVFPNSGDIPEGIYDIDITAPTETGDVTRSVRLSVIDDITTAASATQTNIDISENSIAYNGSISVSAETNSDGQTVTEGKAVLYINGKPYLETNVNNALWRDIPVTLENGFKIGSNQIEVWYKGNETYNTSRSEVKSLTVSKAQITINHSGVNTAADYTGSNMGIDFGEFSFVDEKGGDIKIEAVPEISYTNEQGDTVNPIMPGTYTAVLNLPEGNYYAGVNQAGPELTINPAAPCVTLNIAKQKEPEVTLTAEVNGLIGGCIPTGSVSIIDKSDGSVRGTAELCGNYVDFELSIPDYGEHKFYAVYTPDSNAPYKSASSSDVSVNFERPPEKKMWAANGVGTDNIEVTFTNLTEKDIGNAVMLLAAYDENNVLQRLLQAENIVDAPQGAEQKFSFDLSGVQYESIKIFIWNSLNKMEPLCENYK